jgi:hypothetical protein
MKNEQLDRQIDELERALRHEDPALSKRFDRLQRNSMRNDIVVFSLLAVSAVLLAVGFATLSPFAWAAGAAGYIGSFAVDSRHERGLRGPQPSPVRSSDPVRWRRRRARREQ